jgi:ATP-dependent helicase/DNAse subunit B
MREDITDADREELASLNDLREELVSPLLRLRDSMRSGDSRTFARGIYDYLRETGAAENLLRYAKTLPDPHGDRECAPVGRAYGNSRCVW